MDNMPIQAQQKKQFLQNTDIFQIRIIEIPSHYDVHYYLEQNTFVGTYQQIINGHLQSFREQFFYSTNGDIIQYNEKLSNQFNIITNNQNNGQMIFFENSIVVKMQNCLLKMNANDLAEYYFQIYNDQFLNDQAEYQIYNDQFLANIENCSQVNKNNCFIQKKQMSRIYKLRNLRKFHQMFLKQYISSTQYYKSIVQAFANKQLYYFNIRMTKQIRKSQRQWEDEPILNSNIILRKAKQRDFQIILEIYNICSMKQLNFIKTDDIPQYSFRQCMYIEDKKIIAVLFHQKLDLYHFDNLQIMGSENLGDQWLGRKVMKYDKENGLRIFL